MDDSFRKPFEELRDAVTLPPEELKRRDQIRKNMEEARKRAEEEEAARAAAAASLMTPADGDGAARCPRRPSTRPLPPPVLVRTAGEVAGRPRWNRRPGRGPQTAAPDRGRRATAPRPRRTRCPRRRSPAAPRVVPPISSLDGDRANVTQALSEADLLASAPQPPRRADAAAPARAEPAPRGQARRRRGRRPPRPSGPRARTRPRCCQRTICFPRAAPRLPARTRRRPFPTRRRPRPRPPVAQHATALTRLAQETPPDHHRRPGSRRRRQRSNDVRRAPVGAAPAAAQRRRGVPARHRRVVLLRQDVLRLPDAAGARGLDDRRWRARSRCSASPARRSRSGSTPSWPSTARCWSPARSSSGSCGASSPRASTRKKSGWRWSSPIATAACFLGGALFGYAVLCKPALTYMLSFAEIFPGNLHFKIEPAVMMDEVVGFMLAMLLGTGVAFELPVLLAVLGWLGLVTREGALEVQQVRADSFVPRRRRADARSGHPVAGADGDAAVPAVQHLDPARVDDRARGAQAPGRSSPKRPGADLVPTDSG